jgi:hypothetical protein
MVFHCYSQVYTSSLFLVKYTSIIDNYTQQEVYLRHLRKYVEVVMDAVIRHSATCYSILDGTTYLEVHLYNGRAMCCECGGLRCVHQGQAEQAEKTYQHQHDLGHVGTLNGASQGFKLLR